jgi:hypothetical protein
MITAGESEQIRKRMERISERVNNALDRHSIRGPVVGIKYESNPDDQCPKCQSGLKRKYGFKRGKQKWQCLCCWNVYIEKEIE